MNSLKIAFIISIFFSSTTWACSLWAVSASQTMFLAKNRDWAPNHEQKLKWVQPAKGYKFFGLEASGNEAPGFKMGINEKGLTIVSASLSSIPRKDRLIKNKHGLITEILSDYKSVDEVLEHKEIFKKARPMNYMLADGKKMASIEIALHEKISFDIKETGKLLHTNHILSPELAGDNKKIGPGSVTRYKRLEQLLSLLPNSTVPTMENMKKMSLDKTGGPDASLWRTGSTPKKTRTLSTWIVEYSQTASPTLFIHMANPGKAESEQTLNLDAKFWEKSPAL